MTTQAVPESSESNPDGKSTTHTLLWRASSDAELSSLADCMSKKHKLLQRASSNDALSSPEKKPCGILSNNQSCKKGFNVRFDTVTIREYPIMPGDNPGCLSGPPITIDWEHQGEFQAAVDLYEQERPRRRTAGEICMPAGVRLMMLKDNGYTTNQILTYQKQANIVRNTRKRCNKMSHMGNMTEMTEKFMRGLTNATIRRGKKHKERKYIQQSLLLNAAKVKHAPEERSGLTVDESFSEHAKS